MDPQQKQTAQTFDAYGRTYSSAVNDAIAFTGATVEFFTKVKADYLVDIAKAHFGSIQDKDVLDIGCGVGNYHRLLRPHISKLSGIDVSAECVARARERNEGVVYKVYDGERLPYPDGSFDIAYTICVLHHVPPANWARFVEEMHRVIRPGGLALIFEHNPLNPLTMRAVNNCPFDEDAVLLRCSKTIDLLVGAGFENAVGRYILTIPVKNRALRAADRLFSRVPLGAQYYVKAER